MAKLNLVKTINEIQEESFTTIQIHPFYGLRDAKGWLTRYPIPEEEGKSFISRELAADLCFYGVNFDSNEVWGVSPYKYPERGYWNENLSLKVIDFIGVENFARLYKEEGRVDYFCENIISIIDKGYYVNPEISLKDLRILSRGVCINGTGAKEFQVETPPPMTWGRWSFQKQRLFVAKKLAAKEGEKFSSFSFANTTIGEVMEIICSSGKILLYSFSLEKRINFKSVKGFNVFSVNNPWHTNKKEVFFLWRNTSVFGSHVEGYSLKEAFKNLRNRRSIEGLDFSLRMIWKERMFCFQGTLGFLEDKMPHVARLLQGCNSWEDVPEDILDIVWNLYSRDIFDGYPQP